MMTQTFVTITPAHADWPERRDRVNFEGGGHYLVPPPKGCFSQSSDAECVCGVPANHQTRWRPIALRARNAANALERLFGSDSIPKQGKKAKLNQRKLSRMADREKEEARRSRPTLREETAVHAGLSHGPARIRGLYVFNVRPPNTWSWEQLANALRCGCPRPGLTTADMLFVAVTIHMDTTSRRTSGPRPAWPRCCPSTAPLCQSR